MRTILIVCLLLAGCVTGPDGPSPVVPVGMHQVTEGTFDATMHPLYIGAYPWTHTIRYWGTGKVILQYPAKPHFWLDGEFTWEIVVPEQAAAVANELRAGTFKVGR